MALLPARFTLKMMNDRVDTLDAWFETKADVRVLTAEPLRPHNVPHDKQGQIHRHLE